MFRITPIRASMWRAGWMMLAFSQIAALVAARTGRLTSSGTALAMLSNAWFWGLLGFELAGICASGWVGANGIWSKWRPRTLAKAVAAPQAPTTHTVLTWTMKQLVLGALFLVAGIWLAPMIADTGDGEISLIMGLAVTLGTIGVDYLILARRIGKLERANSVVYYWQRQPGVLEFTDVNVCAVPAYAVVW